MNNLTKFVACVTLGLAVLQPRAVFAAAEQDSTGSRQIKVEQRQFANYIRDAENEYLNATNRFRAGLQQASKTNAALSLLQLSQNNIALSWVRLLVTYKLMEGHPGRVGALKTSIFVSETRSIDRYMTNYEGLRTRAYTLEDKLKALVDALKQKKVNTKALEKFLETAREKINSGADVTSVGQELINQLQKISNTTEVVGPDGKPIPGATVEVDGTVKIGKFRWDKEQGVVFGPDDKPIPGATIKDGKIWIGKCWVDPMTGKVFDPEGKEIEGAQVKNGKIVLPDGTVIDPKTGKPVAIAREGGEGKPDEATTSVGGIVDGSGGLVDAAGSPIEDWQEWLNPDRTVMTERLKRVYINKIGGRIQQEALFLSNAESKEGKAMIKPTEKTGTRIDWAFAIRPVGDQEKAGDGFQAEFELLSDGTKPADAEYAVTAWGVEPGGIRKETGDRKFKVVVPKAGTYTLTVEGQTKQYKSKFSIAQPVSFQ